MHKLEMRFQKFRRVAYLVGDAGGEQSQGGESLGLDGFLGGGARRSDIAEDDRITDGLARAALAAAAGRLFEADGDDIKIKEAMLGIEDLHVARDDLIGFNQPMPLETANPLAQGRAFARFPFEPENFAGGVIEIIDAAIEIGDDDAFADGIE